MLLTISTTSRPATDLGYLLHKNPSSNVVVELSWGTAHIVYPEARDDRCTVALIVDVDPISLVRSHRGLGGDDSLLSQYVNDRPYTTSSLMSVALVKAFSTAMAGRSKERPDLVDVPLNLDVHLPTTSCRRGGQFIQRLFEPLGYEVEIAPIPLGELVLEPGDSDLYDLTLRGEVTVKSLLSHLYVLLPVLDDGKHYWVGSDEVDKLLRQGDAWLGDHAERELIVRSYLRYDRDLTDQALTRLIGDELTDAQTTDAQTTDAQTTDAQTTEPLTSPASGPKVDSMQLSARRLQAVREVLHTRGARRIVDLGCGEGRLVGELLGERGVDYVVGLDVSNQALKRASAHLHLDTMTPRQRSRVELLHGSITYRDRRLLGFDAAVALEVVEHLEPSRLGAFERNIFGFACPGTVVVTTPNAEYNVLYPHLGANEFRHRDHRFEWTRDEFSRWCQRLAQEYGYGLAISGIGGEDRELGAPTQMGVFSR
ncbi:MAG: 3' terminal RNA ribose 2'-O-methyltransferase Hen1 [Ferrimicrobium sp.]|nr:3' terminal RNA ribose 2'-O-methyltransferase Hen1 [Ferrimicrobium sp.]